MIRRRCSFKKYAWKVVSGKSPLIINNSERDRFRSFSVIGKSEQVTTTGRQLFNANKMNGLTKSGVTVSVKDGMITATGMATKDEWIQAYISVEECKKIFKPGEKIFIKSYKTTDCNYDFGLYGAHGSPILGTVTESNSQPKGVLLPTIYPARDTDFYFFVSVKQGVTLKGSLQPMVYQTGNETYEPYTGGKPSPSPEYPQEIRSVGKWNEKKQKYEVDVVVSGKNLFDKESAKIKENWIRRYPNNVNNLMFKVYIGDAKQVTASIKTKLVNGLGFNVGIVIDENPGTYWIYSGTNELATTYKQVVKTEKKYVYVLVNTIAGIDEFLQKVNDFQIEIGVNETDFEPYREPQTVKLTSDRPITKWDKLVEKGGQIGWLYQSAVDNDVKPSRKDLFPYGLSFYKDHGTGVYTYYGTNDKKEIGYQTSLCKQFKNVNGSYTTGGLFHYSDQPSLKTQYFSTDIPTVEEFKQWMENNPLTMLYKTKTPEFVPLPQSEQDSIRSLISYSPTTIITVDGGEVDPSVEVLCAIKEMM